MKSIKLYDGGIIVLAVFVLGVLIFGHGKQEKPVIGPDGNVRIVSWDGQGPLVDDKGTFTWVSVRGMVTKHRDGVLRVNMPGPYPYGAWTQHAGAIATLAAEIPAGTPFTVSFQARSLSGAKFLSVLRRWGSSEPWEHVTLTQDWTTCQVRRTASYPTQFLTFSLAPYSTGLHTVAVGSFEIKDVVVKIEPTKPLPGSVEDTKPSSAK
ncbi:MAG: hypothetical protein WCO98_16750 [bacterium]